MKLSEKIALITGGGRGIGRAVALAFAREGARVAVAARTTEQIERVAEEMRLEYGAEALAVECDVSQGESISSAFSRVAETFGRGVEILVNNAGIAESAPLVKTDDELWQRHIAVNLSGTFYCTRAALPGDASSTLHPSQARRERHISPRTRRRSMACSA
jgi:NAD(P)-dependent dehydrogenase (short-subunit alcohol dehydrogenase family)